MVRCISMQTVRDSLKRKALVVLFPLKGMPSVKIEYVETITTQMSQHYLYGSMFLI
jgi:hypothetical protein